MSVLQGFQNAKTENTKVGTRRQMSEMKRAIFTGHAGSRSTWGSKSRMLSRLYEAGRCASLEGLVTSFLPSTMRWYGSYQNVAAREGTMPPRGAAA